MLLTTLLLATLSGLGNPATSAPVPPVEPQAAPEAKTFSYSYVDAGLMLGDYTGLQLEGSFELDGNWIAVAGFTAGSDDGPDLTSLRGGVGYVAPLSAKLDLIGTGQLEYVDLYKSELGLRARGGLRFAAQEKLQVFGGLEYRTVFDNEWVIDGGALYALSESLSAVGKLELGDYDQFTVGLRFGL